MSNHTTTMSTNADHIEEMEILFKNYMRFAQMIYDDIETEGLCYWRLLDDTPFTKGEVDLAGWNSADNFKRARGDWTYYEEPECYCALDSCISCQVIMANARRSE